MFFGCTPKGGDLNLPDNSQSASARPAAVLLSLRSLHADTSSLLFQYEVENRTEAPIYIFSLLYKTDPSGTVLADANLVYSFFAEDRVLDFRKALLEVPPWAFVEAPEEPYLTKIDKGGSFQEIIRVPLPARCFDPYEENYPPGRQSELIQAKGWRFSLGYIAKLAHPEKVEKEIIAGKEYFIVPYAEGMANQFLLKSNVTQDQLAVFTPARMHEREFVKQSDK